MSDTCPICSNKLLQTPKRFEDYADAHLFNCMRCGSYLLSGRLRDGRLSIATQQERLALSRFLRLQQDRSGRHYEKPLIPSNFEALVKEGLPPSGPIAQINELLKLIASQTANLGDTTKPASALVWAARLGLPSENHFDILANAGHEKGLLRYTKHLIGDEHWPVLKLTMSGWESVEKLPKAYDNFSTHAPLILRSLNKVELYIRQLNLTDFRCFTNTKVSFRVPKTNSQTKQQNITVLLGVNGAGKTSLLRALALSILNESLLALSFHNLIRRGSSEVSTMLDTDCVFNAKEFSGLGRVFTKIERSFAGEVPKLISLELPNTSATESKAIWEEAMRMPNADAFFLVGYGVQRRPSSGALFDIGRQDKRFHTRVQRVASLFMDEAELIPLAAWWPKSKFHDEIQDLFNKVLPDELQLTSGLEGGELLVKFRGVELPETALSDGYRSFIAWFGDLLYRLSQVQKHNKKLKNIRGIVLVDEIDLYLHPSWQQSIIDRVSEALPALQFIVTTHSPLIVGGVHRESLRVLHVDEQGAVTIAEPTQETYGRTPDQILLSDAFGLQQIRPAKFLDDLHLARKKMQTGDIAAAVRYTRMLALGEAGKVVP